jgi:ankyrin repeat protein
MDWTVLHTAASEGELEIVKLLVEKGWDPAGANFPEGNTPLHMAALCGHVEVVEYFISKGMDPDTKNHKDATPLHTLAEMATWQRHFSGEEPADRMRAADFLIRKGAKVNAKDISGMTPLHHAVKDGSREMVEFLIQNGAEVNARDSAGSTPLDMVRDKVLHRELIEYLRSCGALSRKDLDPGRDK